MAKEYLDKTGLTYFWGKLKNYFQVKLVSGTNIKTINNESLLGSGNISISSGAVSGVKGDAESTYRTGNVNLTPANVGAIATSEKYSRSSSGGLDWDDGSTSSTVITKGALAYWNGSYDGTASNLQRLNSTVYVGGTQMLDFVTVQGQSTTSYGDGYWRWREWKSGKVEIWYAGSLTLNSTTSTTSGVTRREKWFNFPNSYSLNKCTAIVNGMNAGAWCGCGGLQNSSSVASDPRRKFEVMAYNISGAPAESQNVNIYICGEKAT